MSDGAMSGKVYLGDGLYAYDDGYMFWLSTEREGRSHIVALEGPVFSKFLEYVEKSRGVKITVEKKPRIAPEPEPELERKEESHG